MRISRLYRSRAWVIAAAVAAAGCKSDPGPAPVTASPTTASESGPSAVDDALPFLEAGAVTHDTKVPTGTRFRLYSWTTPEQAEEIKKTKVLLSRTESPERGASYYDKVMHDAADGGDAVAKLLRSEGFQKSRFAWTSAWPTRMGWPGETYGDVLLSIVIRAGAYVAKRDPVAGTWDVVTTDGTAVAVPELLAHPERLAVVYFESDGSGGVPAYREYVVCNESQVESFTFGMADDLAELDREIAGVEATAKALRERPTAGGVAPRPQMAAAWHDPLSTAPVDPAGKLRRTYLANVAFENELYVLDPARLDAIAASLRKARSAQPSGSYFGGAARFAGAGSAAPPPAPKPTYRGTYYGTYMPPRRKTGGAPH